MTQSIDIADLVGAWMLIRAEAVDAEGRAMRPPYGPEPMGRLVLATNGRMMAMLGDGRATMPDAERRAFVAYGGNYRIDNGHLMTTVDAASLKGLIGNLEVRRIEMRQGQLVLTPPPQASGEQRELTWRRCGPA